jgi:hypothetical protein
MIKLFVFQSRLQPWKYRLIYPSYQRSWTLSMSVPSSTISYLTLSSARYSSRPPPRMILPLDCGTRRPREDRPPLMLSVFASRTSDEGGVTFVSGGLLRDEVCTIRQAVPCPGVLVFLYCGSKFKTYALLTKMIFFASVIPCGISIVVKLFVLAA